MGSPVAVQLRIAGASERTFTFMGLASRVTETVDKDNLSGRNIILSMALILLVTTVVEIFQLLREIRE